MKSEDVNQLTTHGALADQKRLQVYLIDDSTLVHAGLTHTLRSHSDIELVGYARDDATALEAALDASLDAVVVSSLCRSIDVLRLIRRVAQLRDNGAAHVLLLVNAVTDPVRVDAEKLGVGGVIFTWEAPRILVSALRIVANGYNVGAPGEPPPAARLPLGQTWGGLRDTLDLLTPRERDVLQLMARGLKNSEIAEELVVSGSTVKTHVQNLLVKLGLRNRASAVAVAYELGLTGSHGSVTDGPAPSAGLHCTT